MGGDRLKGQGMKLFPVLAVITGLLLPTTALPESNVETVFFYRSNVMEASSAHLKALRRYVEGGFSLKTHVKGHADALLALNAMYKDLFPKGQKQHPDSEAKRVIWRDTLGFKAAIRNNKRKIMALQAVDPADRPKLKKAVNEVRMSCNDCHYYFRKK